MATVTLYGAPWCGPCKAAREMMASMGVCFEYVDVDARPDEGDAAEVKAVPTIVIREGESELGRMAGGVTMNGLAELFRATGV